MGGPKPVKPAPAPAIPTTSDPAANEAAKKARQAELKAGGHQSTILTGALGLSETAEKIKKRTLLGG